MKKFLCLSALVFCLSQAMLSSQEISEMQNKYRIKNADYAVKGMTKPGRIAQTVKVDFERIFDSEESLVNYIKDYETRLLNTRLFSTASVYFSVSEEAAEDGTKSVTLSVSTEDSSHFIALPYPSYSSSKGFEMKLRAIDTNFLGTMSEAKAHLMYGYGTRDENDSVNRHKLGAGFSYDFPFQAGIFDAQWQNDLELTYGIGETQPDWLVRTGLLFSKKLSLRTEIQFGAFQTSSGDLDYRAFDDSIYFTEETLVALPIIIFFNDKWNNIYYTPKIDFIFNWDKNGIDRLNYDLAGPDLSVGHSISTGRVNWTDQNFRNGIKIELSESLGYDFSQNFGLFHNMSLDVQAFKAFKYAGLAGRLYAFYDWNNTDRREFGANLRGIRDNQYFAYATTGANAKAAKSRAAIVLNFDAPIHLFTINTAKFRETLDEASAKNKILKILDIDFQLSPFIDLAIFYNEATGSILHPKDGFYAAGAELILSLVHWRSIQFRVSAGFDVGRLVFGKFIDTSWRRDVSPYELTIGVGLHY